MTKIMAIAWKDALIRFSSRTELLFFLGLPILFTFLLGGGLGGAPGDDVRIPLLVAEPAAGALAAEVLATLEKSETVRAEVLPLVEAEREFEARNAAALLIFPANFEQAREVELRQQPNDLNAQAAQRAVLAALGEVGLAATTAQNSVDWAERLRSFASEAERQAYYDEAFAAAQELLASAPDRLEVTRPELPANTRYDPAPQASAGQLITWVFIPLIGISALFAYERQQGTLRRLFTTPTTRATYLLGTISGQVVDALVQMTLLVAFGSLVLKLNWSREPAALGAILLSSALAAAGLGAMLGTFIKTEGQANGLSIMLGMVMALLGGCWYPIELFPEAVRTAVQVLPTTWAMQGMLDLLIRGQGLSGVLPEAGVLLGFAAAFLTVGVWRFRYE